VTSEEIEGAVKNKCASCGTTGGDLSRCSRCKKAYYCGVDCQKKDYPEHKKVCPATTVTQSSKDLSSPEPLKENTKSGIDEFTDLKFVGKGNFSEIFSAVSLKDGKTYAIKQIDKSKLKRLEKEADVFMEKHCLQKLKGWPYAIQI
jgi:3-phosphoinositide dependent protein kinase-1